MNKRLSIIYVLIAILVLILMHNSIINLMANLNTLFRKDNRVELITNSYEKRIDNLKREISEYEDNSKLEISKDKSLVLAKVALRNIYDLYDYLIVSTNTLVKDNEAAINEKGLVGITDISCKENTKIKLLSGKNKVSVKVNNVYGLMGEYNRKTKLFKITNISNYEPINKGDTVTTSGLNEIPKDIYVGRVVDVLNKGIERVVYVKSDVDFDNLNYLYIVDTK